MQRITTPDHLFHDGDPFNGIQGTPVTADFLNAVQEEIATVIEAAGIPLSAATSTQLLNALTQIFAGLNSPILTGIPKAPTAIPSDNSTQIANTYWTRTFVAAYLQTTLPKGRLYFLGQN